MPRTGKIKVFIDEAEHGKMDTIFNDFSEALGGILDIQRKTLPYGDYWLKPEGGPMFVFTFKEISDFQRSFFSGHLNEEINAIYEQAGENDVKALIIANDTETTTKREVQVWVGTHWRKRNFLIPTFKFGSREKAVEFMAGCAMTEKSLTYLERKIQKDDDSDGVVGVYSWYGVGKATATALAEKYPKPIDLFTAMLQHREWNDLTKATFKTKKVWRENRWWSDVPNLGEKKARSIEALILDGVPIQRAPRSRT